MQTSKVLPRLGAILLTYRCNAECDECCFECSPDRNSPKFDIEKIKEFIDQISKKDGIQLLVWSGGECFLEYQTLTLGIDYAKKKGFNSRCVSNAFWASSIEQATKKLLPLKQSGLVELNFSTGDSHQKFVPIERVMNAIVAALQLGMKVFIAVESTSSSKFKPQDILENELYVNNIRGRELEKSFSIEPTVWVSFHDNNNYDYGEIIGNSGGCEGIFDTISIEPSFGLMGCCGITSNHIQELHLGKISEGNVYERYLAQQDDFLKLWIFTEGPEVIVKQASEWLGVDAPKFYHKCLYCAYLYQSNEIRSAIAENYHFVEERVLKKYQTETVLQSAFTS